MSERYKVEEGSNSCHCCFEYTVFDTTVKTGYDPKPFGSVCETFDKADAEIICAALNFKHDVEEAARRAGGKTSFLVELTNEGLKGSKHDA